ncbi:MAG: hypothetical protein ACI3XR_09345 [Eubacteriales bacterium]
METKMKIILYGEDAECHQALDELRTFPMLLNHPNEYLSVNNRETLQKQLVEWNPGLIIVLANRSEGMEGVYLVKEIRPEVPVFWFSDDEGFGMQSHRLECDYFAVKPFNSEKLSKAFQRCTHMGVRISGMKIPVSHE